MKKNTIFIISFVFVFLFPLGLAAKEKHSLQLRYKEGDSFTYRFETIQEINQIINRNWISFRMLLALDLRFDVEEIDQNEYAVRITYERIQFSQSRNRSLLVEFDSQNPPEEMPDLLKGSAALIDESFSVVINSHGKVVQILHIDRLIETLREKIIIDDEEVKEQVLTNFKNQFDDDALKDLFQNLWVYPEKKVAIGETWNHQFSLKKNIPMEVSAQYRLDDVSKDTAELSVVSDLSSLASGSKMQVGDIELLYFIKGKQTGNIVIEQDGGRLVSGKLTQALSGKVVMSQNDRHWPISIVSTISFSLLK